MAAGNYLVEGRGLLPLIQSKADIERDHEGEKRWNRRKLFMGKWFCKKKKITTWGS